MFYKSISFEVDFYRFFYFFISLFIKVYFSFFFWNFTFFPFIRSFLSSLWKGHSLSYGRLHNEKMLLTDMIIVLWRWRSIRRDIHICRRYNIIIWSLLSRWCWRWRCWNYPTAIITTCTTRLRVPMHLLLC